MLIQRLLWISLILFELGLRPCLAQQPAVEARLVDSGLVEWLQSHKSDLTGMPLSFGITEANRKEVLERMGDQDSITGIIERIIVEEGTSVYDTAVWQIALAALGGEENLRAASVPIETYWRGSLRHLHNIRAGRGGGQTFIYDRDQPDAISSDLTDLGRRGFVFRILNAHGKYLAADPLDGKRRFSGFPNWPDIHWEDWKPIAGENAWVVIAAMQIYHHKYFDYESGQYRHTAEPVELALAKEIARAAIHLQANNGAVRMAPIGTYFFSLDEISGGTAREVAAELDEKATASKESYERLVREWGEERTILQSEHTTWYYDEISTENNLSWFTAFKLLYEVTEDPEYRLAMLRIERYLKSVWNADEHYFFQGAHFTEGFWEPNSEHFATDVQTWAICKLGPARLDEWFGEGAAYRIWQTTKEFSGIYSPEGRLQGVGYTRESRRLSIEWTVGAIYAMNELVRYYGENHPEWSRQASGEARDMRAGIERFYRHASDGKAAYSYSSRRGWIPFGWFSHDKEVLSLVSTCWVVLYDLGFNPFRLYPQPR
ncbi:MAG: hypothetical protein KC897_06235 [Candidatus Omnitrophica bacterium]|nr:hypothetical protein [Candidatus Omnitrophota bacterium]MCB9721403.1 hypothetical protein [Candidatus Omnitrophota bacterium]